MSNDAAAIAHRDFDTYHSMMCELFPYVEDDTFKWEDVIGLLIIQLKNTDSLNKANQKSHATQIQITSEKDPSVLRSTEDFFPTLTLNSSFKSWRISIPTRIHLNNINELKGMVISDSATWMMDSVQIRRRILNDDGTGYGNPNLQICYGNDLMPLRELLSVNDYLVLAKRKNKAGYEAFGVRGTTDLGSGKKMHLSASSSTDSSVFNLGYISDAPAEDNGTLGSFSPNGNNPTCVSTAENILLYGVPGCGKSHTIKTEYCNDDTHMERAVFHPDYTYSDFTGQILPRVIDGHIEYQFEPGPFTRILRKAYEYPAETFYIVVEEINRGNAPAIFGDIFQLLDRDENGCSEYGVSNENIAEYVHGDKNIKIKIPGNLYVLATMNTSDQNVFTLDTAFKRRWIMRMIENNIDACKYANTQICAWGVTWGSFVKTINQKITELGENNLSNEDNRLGAYFVREKDLHDAERFGEKVLMYLWNDALKFDRDKVFKSEYRTLDELIAAFMQIGFAIFNDDIIFAPMTTENDDIIEVDNPTADQYLEGKNPNLIAIYHRLFDVIIDKIPNVYANSISSLAYIAWKTNDIKKSSFADINIQRNRIVIWTEPPTADHTFTVGEQIPNDKHHNHYFKIIYDEEQLDQIISIIVESYNQLKTQ